MAKDVQLGQIGRLGEGVAVRYLKSKNFEIIATNVTYTFGEIDIVALKNNVYHFVEVKTMDSESIMQIKLSERVGVQKMNRIKKAIQSYVAEKDLFGHQLQIDLIMVKLNQQSRQARIKVLRNLH